MAEKNQIESLLFVSHKPLSVKELAKLTGATEAATKTALVALADDYRLRSGGIQLLESGDKYQLVTAAASSQVVQKFIKSEMTGELTRPSLEALTIIAYRGPISKAELELIRGVNCSIILRNLLMRGLVESAEDKQRGITLYNITFDFLKFLGLSKIEELPDFEKLNRNNNLDKLLNAEMGDNLNHND
ncbi:MAG TPA: SMC-Scp complex subunit ScpB [bacterium]|nr:SMC-Scp complex subunit ScpB [bacterium]HNS34265.1 SMC-Scp complex subunit ScpB [bacterium]HNW09261.1 SMC-Scp complex subunit ScpB [bacterium]HNZ73069.1 SMC-Scp complex subunit ScpB [bacterium]HOH67166.1 SMC-Scp complex subunit ScpB [bacterium]